MNKFRVFISRCGIEMGYLFIFADTKVDAEREAMRRLGSDYLIAAQ